MSNADNGITNADSLVSQGLASIPAVKQYLRHAEALGIDCQPLLDQAGICAQDLNDNNHWIPATALEKLLSILIPASNDPCFGLHTARFISMDMYNVQGYINMNCSSLREVWGQTPIYEKIVGDMGVSTPVYGEQVSSLRWHCNYTDPLVRRHITETILASWHRYVREYLLPDQSDKGPIQVCFVHNPPETPELLTEYQDAFGCEVLFDQPYNAISIDNELLDLPIAQANPHLLASLLDHATQLLRELDKNRSFTEQVKNLLRLMITKEIPRREAIAEQLHMNSRTLQRKLAEEGSSYQALLDELRLEMACHYLSKTDLSMEVIAEKLGFAETRSFYRQFKNLCGVTAGAYRKERRLSS
ncbi:AraC family transcriptional regulator [Pseudomaricurvus alkylphenolicus]|jgi:AraC-like DNA-binding protein|uniref:AraC family transcriptional regulator n=1 Tax=Pseudomaricurvus alkylphenolicus TaxID=1306991 RepID=UPI00141F9A1D|nr:AraC family transcriptional regulator [Pseudomaricurvus alkylphenolicus]NIB38610.1 AraC family transcriptional regulator [Pseudomaricurvus alkylphenolicus]